MDDVGAVLYGPGEIAAAVERVAAAVTAGHPRGEPLVLLAVLKGAGPFAEDLAAALAGRLTVERAALAVTSYGNSTRSSGKPRLVRDTTASIEGKHVLIVEDIVEQGLTLRFVRDLLARRRPASLRACALLDKPDARTVPVELDYAGLTAPDAFIVGYGLDYQERYRNLPYLAALSRERETSGGLGNRNG